MIKANSCYQEAYLSYGWSDFPAVGETFAIPMAEAEEVAIATRYPPKAIDESVARDRAEIPARHEHRVSFDTAIQVRTHDLELGDHPCCLGGMALQCGWAYSEDTIVDLNTHESHALKRRGNELRLSFRQRRKRLQEVTGLNGAELLRLEYRLLCEEEKDDTGLPVGRETPSVLHHSNSFKIFHA